MSQRRNSSGLRWNISKHYFEIVTRSRLWSTVSKRGTHLDSFFIPNYSYKIKITMLCDMPVASTSSRTFISQNNIVDFIDDFWRSSFNWTSWTRCIICGCTTTFKFTQLYTVTNAGTDVLWTLSNSALICFGVKPFIYRYLITTRNSFFSILQKIQRLFALIVYRNKIMRWIPPKTWQ